MYCVLAATSYLNLPQNFNLTSCFTLSYNSDLYHHHYHHQQQQAARPHQIQGNEVSTPAISQQKAAPPRLSTRAFILVAKPLFKSGDACRFVACTLTALAPVVPEHGYLLYTCHRIVTQHTHCVAGIVSTQQNDIVIKLNNGDAH